MIHTARSTGKFMRLVRWIRNQIPDCPVDYETVAVGLLERLWHFTITSHKRGDIGASDNEIIAEAIGWHGDADELVSQLVETKWLIEHSSHRLVINDWPEHAPAFIKKNAHRWGGLIGQSEGSGEQNGSGEQSCPDKTAQVSGFDPTPNVTKPNVTKSIDRSITRDPIDVSGKEQDIRELATSIAQEFDGERRLKPDDRELAFKAAVFEHCVPELRGMVVNLRIKVGQKLRGREPPANPWAYFKAGLIKTCEEYDVDFHGVWERIAVPQRKPNRSNPSAEKNQ